MRIDEAKDLQLYKKLLRILAEYSKRTPATGVDRLFDMAVSVGKKACPKDKQAMAILDNILNEKDPANSVSQLLNARFSTLPVDLRPLVKKGRRHEVAFWMCKDVISDRVKDLIDWEGKGGSGKWTDVNGQKVTLIDMGKKEE